MSSKHENPAPAAPPAPQQQAVITLKTAAARAGGIKKFSNKLLSPFRLGRPRPVDDTNWDSASTRESSPDVHQLTSRRRRGGGGDVKRPTRNGLSRIIADSNNPPCPACEAINFPRLLNWTPGQPRPWIPLAHTLAGDSECPYCIFFQALVGAWPDETRKFTPYLRIRQAFERLGVGEKHELGSAVLLEVTTKSKALPWGYIVKAVEGDDDVAGYQSDTAMLRGRIVSPKLDPVLPRTWIDFCTANHTFSGCGTRGPLTRGLKLIDCNEEEVIFVDDLNTEAIEYVTLSYVGGKGEEGEVHQQNSGLPSVLPPLIADAVNITKSLGFRYLWVDRYCFHQNSASERKRQLGLLGDIFFRSALTIIVAAGEGINDGIPGISIPREEQLSLQTEDGFFTTSLTRPDVEVASSKWASRGWTYQEGLLSRRRLVFTSSQVYFQCQSLHCHESISYPLKTKPTLNLGRVFPLHGAGTRAGEYKNRINDYISRDFTNFSERLDAFRGVLDRYAIMDPPMESFLGLPLYHTKDFKHGAKITMKDRLVIGLGWKADQMTDDPNYVHPLYLYGTFPSWTWLAWKIRPEHSRYEPKFQFYDVGNGSPLIDHVTAAPDLEASVGFGDDGVLSWETDADLILAKSESVLFLRLKAHCFDIHLKKEEDGTTTFVSPDLKDSYRPTLISCLSRASSPESDGEPPAGEHDLVGILLSGRDFKHNGGFESANILICGKRNWEAEGKLVRLGTLEIAGGDGAGLDGSSLKGVLNEEKKLSTQVREVDIY